MGHHHQTMVYELALELDKDLEHQLDMEQGMVLRHD